MMPPLAELFQLEPVRWGVLALLISGVTLPVTGVFIVGLNIIPMRFAIMHVALLGVTIGLILGVEPLITALVLCGLSGAFMAPFANRSIGLSGASGLLMTVSIAAALLALSISGVNATGAFELLWGSLLALQAPDVIALTVVGGASLALFLLRRRELALLLYDREIAVASGVAVGTLTVVLLTLVSLAVASALRLTGALLVDAVTLLPALAARAVASSLNRMVILAMTFGLVGNVVGFSLALVLDQPPGPILVLVAGTITLVAYVFGGSK